MSMLMASYQVSVVNDGTQATPTNFQQLIQTTLQYPSGVRFWSPTDGWLYGWLESLSSTNQANIWVNIPSSIPANGVYQIYMVEDSSLNFDGVYWGEAAQLSSTYGQYDNIANVMEPGLIYQIYYFSSGTCGSSCCQNNVYAAPLGNGVTIQTCASFTSSTNPFTTSQTGTTQDVNGTNENYVILNYQEGYQGGVAYPNPPVANNSYSWIIKTIGWADLPNATVTFYGMGDDGIAAGYSTGGGTSSGGYWLGGTSNPNNIYSGWHDEGATTYSGTVPAGTYRVEQDYYEDGGGAYTAFWTSASVNYYHATYPPNGVMPETAIVPLQAWEVFVPPLP